MDLYVCLFVFVIYKTPLKKIDAIAPFLIQETDVQNRSPTCHTAGMWQHVCLLQDLALAFESAFSALESLRGVQMTSPTKSRQFPVFLRGVP